MTSEYKMAKENAVHFEAKKTGFGQAQDGWSLTLRMQDSDVPDNVRDAKKGTRFMVALVEIDDNELPIQAQENVNKPKSFAGQAKMLAKDESIILFLNKSEYRPFMSLSEVVDAETAIEFICNVKSCADIIEGTEAGDKFKTLQREYLRWRDS